MARLRKLNFQLFMPTAVSELALGTTLFLLCQHNAHTIPTQAEMAIAAEDHFRNGLHMTYNLELTEKVLWGVVGFAIYFGTARFS